MFEESAQDAVLALDGACVTAGSRSEIADAHQREIGQRVEFEISPGTFRRVQLRRMGRKELRMKARMSSRISFHPGGQVRTEVIPQQDNPPLELPGELVEECGDPFGADILVGVRPKVEADTVALRRNGQRADDGDFLVGVGALAKDGRLTARSPASPHERGHKHARFVQKG